MYYVVLRKKERKLFEFSSKYNISRTIFLRMKFRKKKNYGIRISFLEKKS